MSKFKSNREISPQRQKKSSSRKTNVQKSSIAHHEDDSDPRNGKCQTEKSDDITSYEHESELISYDGSILERSLTQWQFGDWESLIRIRHETIEHHPDRARLALFAAAGRLQQGNMSEGRQYARLAKEWGCSNKIIARALISGVHNSLARAATLEGDEQRAIKHFESAIFIGAPRSDARLIARARIVYQIERLGLVPNKHILFNSGTGALAAITLRSADLRGRTDDNGTSSKTFCAEAYACYEKLAEQVKKNADLPPFILLESKSLPRSGIHYMKRTFSKILGDSFTFCEWYQEPGCCKKMPCALTAYTHKLKEKRTASIRLTKSHDFELNDPQYPAIQSARRAIIVRDPLYLLTSWYALDCLSHYGDALRRVGIDMKKIWYLHEPEMTTAAYNVLDEFIITPSEDEVKKWISEKTDYMVRFLEKWVFPLADKPEEFCYIVHYTNINSFIAEQLNEICDAMDEQTMSRFDNFLCNGAQMFHPRLNPFEGPSERLTKIMESYSSEFECAAQEIYTQDRFGILSTTK